MEENKTSEKAQWLEPIAALIGKENGLKQQLIVMLNDNENCIMERKCEKMPTLTGKEEAYSTKFLVVTSVGIVACYVISRNNISQYPDRVTAVVNEKGNLVCFV